MATGKVLQFDYGRGWGFVAADDGGEDVFLHASAFDGDSYDLTPGTSLEFEIMSSDRGRKAFAVRFAAEEPAPGPSAQARAQATIPPQAVALKQAAAAPQVLTTDEEQMCDVLSQPEFGTEITELLLKTIPALSGPQILEIRQGLLDFARNRGWVDS